MGKTIRYHTTCKNCGQDKVWENIVNVTHFYNGEDIMLLHVPCFMCFKCNFVVYRSSLQINTLLKHASEHGLNLIMFDDDALNDLE